MAQASQGPTDEQLVERYRDGDGEAFIVLMGRYRQELYHFLVRRIGDRSIAEDLFQETFLQIHLSIDRFDTSRRFRPWLFTIAANKGRDYLRRNRQRFESEIAANVATSRDSGDLEVSVIDLLRDGLPLPDEHAERSEVQAVVRGVVEEMPDHLREIITLAYFHQLPYREVAEVLSIPLGTVKSRLHAAVAAFATLWKQRFDDASELSRPPSS